MRLKEVQRLKYISRDQFREEFLKPSVPLVLMGMTENWAALEKWSFEYIAEHYGDQVVPLYDKEYRKPGKKYMEPSVFMRIREYLALIQKEPTDLRMFLYNLVEEAPELMEDYNFPELMVGFLKGYQYMYFGGEGSYDNLHYDIDCSSVFHTQFQDQKECILFPPSQSKKLYAEPFTVQTAVDLMNPDYEKYPAFKYAEGYRTILNHGETLFIPSMYWHCMQFLRPGFSLSLRANPNLYLVKGLFNISRHFVIDKGMNNLLGKQWSIMKKSLAVYRAANALP